MEYKELRLDELDEHPDNPRLFYRDEVIDSIVHEVELRGKEVFANDKAISVAPRNKRFVIYKGHHRYIAAKKAEELDTVYCWIDTDITDEEMFIELLLDNNQAELSPLERGKHAFTHIEKHSEEGKSIKDYANRIGESQQRVTQLYTAYEVFKYCKENKSQLLFTDLNKLSAEHYRIIHPVPQDYWVLLVKSAIDYHWNTEDLGLRVKSLENVLTIPKYLNKWLIPKKIIEEIMKNPNLGEKYKRLGEVAKECYDKLKEKITLHNIENEFEEDERAKEFTYKPQKNFINKLRKKHPSRLKDVRKIYSEIITHIDEKENAYQDFLKRENDKEERKRQERERELKQLELQQKYEPEFFNQDCLAMSNEQVANGSVDLILTDPPYGVSDGSFTFYAGKPAPVDKGEWDKKENIPSIKKWIDLCAKKLKPGANLFVCATYHNLFDVGHVIQKHKDLRIIQCLGWQSKNPAPILVDDRFGYIFELVVFARKKGKVNYFDREVIEDTENRKQVGNYWVLDIPRGEDRFHPTQKPEELANRIINCACPEDGLVLDLFVGSGTFLVSAKRNKRRSIGFEKNKEFYKKAIERIDKVEVELGGEIP